MRHIIEKKTLLLCKLMDIKYNVTFVPHVEKIVTDGRRNINLPCLTEIRTTAPVSIDD
jgi:hypothetical protein|uniref:Uncharacterized protein n=1 Tax=viral metagenome TaxID=1070528 RepID=A0A6C0J0D5_9ZZZZ